MIVDFEGAKRRASDVAVVLVTALAVTSVMGMPVAAATPTDTGILRTPSEVVPAESGEETTPVIGQTLRSRIAAVDANETVRVLVLLDDQPDVETIRERAESRDDLLRRLERRANASQAPVLRSIEELRTSGDVTAVERHWLVNALSVEASPEAVRAIAQMPGVAAVLADVELRASTATPVSAPTEQNTTDHDSNTNVTVRNVDRVERSTSAPRALHARDAVGLPERFAAPGIREFDVEGTSGPEPITGSPSAEIPEPASTPFDDDDVAWGVEKVHADAATRAGYDGSNVTVAVIDTGIDDSHPDLDDRVVGWTDLVNGFENPYDDGGHGTHVAGTIAGTGDGGLRTGVAPGADLLGVKVLDGRGSGLLSDVMRTG